MDFRDNSHRGSYAKQKGQRGEREIVMLLKPIIVTELALLRNPSVELDVRRNVLQSQQGGSDLAGIPFLNGEVKYCENEKLSAWWRQTLAAEKPGQESVLFYRKNKEAWKVRMFARLHVSDGKKVRTPVDISIAAFLTWFQLEVRAWLLRQQLENGNIAETATSSERQQ